ncbi:MAG: L,D-transpeptidase family protein [Micromonosporaceae bacterium]|nr:L,D-transpeptidase family protein [Micromonosporaceae bacterium]
MRSTTGALVASIAAAAVVSLGAGAYAFGPQPDRRLTIADQAAATGDASPAGKPERPGSPSATGEDGEPGRSGSAAPATKCPVGERQREVETRLAKLGGFGKVVIDGQQSDADCKAIKKFQRRYGIYPAKGRAGPVTAQVARRLAGTDLDACDLKGSMTVCLDLTHQTMWVVRDGSTVLGPTVVRTGRRGLETPSGHFTITEKKPRPISTYYKVPLPYWQRFVRDMGFHETPSYLHEGPGSHGCVNLLRADAVKLWNLTKVGTPVHAFGRKPA